jgi:hypothetical protein
MKAPLLSSAVLGVILFLPAAVQAQNFRPPAAPDPRYPTPAYAEPRESLILHEVQSLQSSTQAIYTSYVAYCKRMKVAAATPDGQLLRAMIDLNQDVGRLAVQVRAHCNNRSLPLGAAYRAHHLAEYSSRDSQLMAAEAGYMRSMFPYFQDIEQHLEEIGRLGYRNPLVRRTEMDSRYSGRFSGVRERQIDLPPLPSVQPPPSVPVPPRRRDYDRNDKADIGDLLKELFRSRLN